MSPELSNICLRAVLEHVLPRWLAQGWYIPLETPLSLLAWADNLFLFCVNSVAAKGMVSDLVKALWLATWELKWEETELLLPYSRSWKLVCAGHTVTQSEEVKILGVPVCPSNSPDGHVGRRVQSLEATWRRSVQLFGAKGLGRRVRLTIAMRWLRGALTFGAGAHRFLGQHLLGS